MGALEHVFSQLNLLPVTKQSAPPSKTQTPTAFFSKESAQTFFALNLMKIKDVEELISRVYLWVGKQYSDLNFECRVQLCAELIKFLQNYQEYEFLSSIDFSFVQKTLRSQKAFKEHFVKSDNFKEESAINSTEVDEIEVPSRETSLALASFAVNNSEAIDRQTEEASKYIRTTRIKVDNKVDELQKKLREDLTQLLKKFDETKNSLCEIVNESKEVRSRLKGEMGFFVNALAEKVLEMIKNQEDVQSEVLEKDQKPETEMGSYELKIGDQTINLAELVAHQVKEFRQSQPGYQH